MTVPVIAPGAVPLLGHLPALVNNPWAFLTSLPGRGDLVRINVGPWHAYVLCDAELVHRVLVDDRTFDKGGPLFDKAREVLGDGLATCPHSLHRRQRRLVQPAFHPARMPRYAAAITEQIDTATARWQHGDVLDVPAELHTLITTMALRTLFAAELPSATITEMRRSVQIAMAGIYRRLLTPGALLDRLPTPANLRYNQARAHLRGTVDGIIADYRRSGTDHGDLLSMLLAARDPSAHSDEETLSDAEISDQVTTFLVSGIVSTTSALSWVMHLMATHPEIDHRVHTEATSVFADRTAAFTDLPRLDTARRVIQETMRLYPPGWVFTRIVATAADLDGYRIPTGAVLLYSPYLLHRRADLFPSPDRFDPDRWSPDRVAGIPRGAYIPFGAGPRKCIGEAFVLMQTTLVLASIAARWRMEPLAGNPTVRPALRATLIPRRLRLRLFRRGQLGHNPAARDE